MKLTRTIFRSALGKPFFLIGLLLFLNQPCFAQLDQWGYWENGLTESWWFSSKEFSAEEAVTAASRWKQIGTELNQKEILHGAGDYFRGSDTHGTYVRWAPQSGFIMAHIDKCQAKVMGLTYGSVKISGPQIHFIPELSKVYSHSSGHTHSNQLPEMRFVQVGWGRSLLLLNEAELGDFGDYVAGLGKYNYSDFRYSYYEEFFRRLNHASSESAKEDESLQPKMPSGYERFLKKPIEATITGVGRRILKRGYSYENPDGSGASHERVSITFVTVDVGTQNGVSAGMFLRVKVPDEGERVRLTRVGKTLSTGILIRDIGETYFDSEKQIPHSKPEVGWKLTTTPF
jgi:hypothetical protein